MKDIETMHKWVYGFLDQYKDRVSEEYKQVRNFVAKFLSAEKKKKRICKTGQ